MSNGISHKVFNVRDRGEGKKSSWTEIGVGFENKDGSLNLMLDAVPISGKIQVRPYEPKAKED